jgi:hypothetical protein
MPTVMPRLRPGQVRPRRGRLLQPRHYRAPGPVQDARSRAEIATAVVGWGVLCRGRGGNHVPQPRACLGVSVHHAAYDDASTMLFAQTWLPCAAPTALLGLSFFPASLVPPKFSSLAF